MEAETAPRGGGIAGYSRIKGLHTPINSDFLAVQVADSCKNLDLWEGLALNRDPIQGCKVVLSSNLRRLMCQPPYPPEAISFSHLLRLPLRTKLVNLKLYCFFSGTASPQQEPQSPLEPQVGNEAAADC